jgi:hypothetical protein
LQPKNNNNNNSNNERQGTTTTTTTTTKVSIAVQVLHCPFSLTHSLSLSLSHAHTIQMAQKADKAMIRLQPEELMDQDRPEQTKKNMVKGHMIASNSQAAPPSPVAPPAAAPLQVPAPKSPTLLEIIRTFSSDSEMSTEHVKVNANDRQEGESLSEFWDRRDKRIQAMYDADNLEDSSIFHYGLHRN